MTSSMVSIGLMQGKYRYWPASFIRELAISGFASRKAL